MRRHDRDYRADPLSHVEVRPRPVAPVEVFDWEREVPELGVGTYPDGLDPT